MKLALLKKELLVRFNGPLIYLLAGVFNFLGGWLFFNLLMNYIEVVQKQPGAEISFDQYVVFGFFGNINFMLALILPVLTMDSFAREQERGTLNLLTLSRLTYWDIIWSKFFELLLSLIFLLSGLSVIVLVLWFANLNQYEYLLSGFIGLLLNGISYICIGLFFSMLTRASFIAAFLSVSFVFFLWMLPWSEQLFDHYYLVELVSKLSINSHFQQIVSGLINTESIMFYTSLMALFLFFTRKVFELKRLK
jgi:ABC-2 type transport system permease protein